MPDENRVFDVAKPGRSAPQPTSKPVIVGHQPTLNDPMMKDGDSSLNFGTESPTKISVMDHSGGPVITPPKGSASTTDTDHNSWISTPADEPTPSHVPSPDLNLPEEPDTSPLTDTPAVEQTASDGHEKVPHEAAAANQPVAEVPAPDFTGHVEGLHLATPKRGGHGKFIILVLLILLIGAYLLIDSGTIGSGINLPFHIFKQKTPAPAASTSSTQSKVNTASSVPAGFTKYNIADTTVTFAAPTAWGAPTSVNDPGYTARGGTNKSDGTYAYIVNFAANKDVEIAVTSAKYLPAARGSLYYDFLQWCIGTNDNKYYLQTMHFTTSADKTDTPATITCDQGPLAGAQKIDDSTILITQVKANDGKTVIGDVYTKNLNNSDLPVFRVKDAAMTNGADIKQLLGTVKIVAAS